MRKRTPTIDRVLRRIVMGPDGCWIWTGATNDFGHGIVQLGRGIGTARCHRIVYEAVVGPIPEGKVLHHTCERPACINPDHLIPVSQVDHMMILHADVCPTAINKAKTHCPRGHEYIPENTYVKRSGWRECRICRRDRQREAYAKRSASPRAAAGS